MEIGGKQLPSCRPPISYLKSIRQRPFLSCECEQKTSLSKRMICQGALCPAKKSALKVSWMSAQWTRGIAASACGAFCTSSGTFSRRYKAWPPPEFHNAIPRRSSSISAGASTTGTSRSKNLSTVSFGASRFRRSGVCSKFPTRVKILTASRLPARVCCSEGMAARGGKKNWRRRTVLSWFHWDSSQLPQMKNNMTAASFVCVTKARVQFELMSHVHFTLPPLEKRCCRNRIPSTYKPHVSGSRQNCRFSKPMQS